MQRSLLLVDDDQQFSKALQAYLEAVNYKVTVRNDADSGFEQLNKFSFDLLILDLSLPDEDGLCVLRKLRQQRDLPVIIISGRSSDEDRVAGLELGADDYVVKPFSPKELALRIEKRLSLSPGQDNAHQSNKIQLGAWVFDKKSLSVTDSRGEEVELTPRELDVLSTLASHLGQVLSREQLIDGSMQVVGPESTRAIDISISRLRKKLEEDPSEPKLIKTVKGFGYKLVDVQAS